MAEPKDRHDRADRRLWPALALPGTFWLIALFLVPVYAVMAVAFSGSINIFDEPVPAWHPLDWQFESGDRFTFKILPQGDRPPDEFDVYESEVKTVVVPAGTHAWTRYQFTGTAAEKRRVSGEVVYELGKFYDGELTTIEGTVRIKPAPILTIELAGERGCDRYRPVLERQARVPRVVLEPEAVDPERGPEALRRDERRRADAEATQGRGIDGQELEVSPDAGRTRLDRRARGPGPDDLCVVGDLERPEARLADVGRTEGFRSPAVAADEPDDARTRRSRAAGAALGRGRCGKRLVGRLADRCLGRHRRPPGSGAGSGGDGPAETGNPFLLRKGLIEIPYLAGGPARTWHLAGCSPVGCRGFIGPVPPPLLISVSSVVGRAYQTAVWRRATSSVDHSRRRGRCWP